MKKVVFFVGTIISCVHAMAQTADLQPAVWAMPPSASAMATANYAEKLDSIVTYDSDGQRTELRKYEYSAKGELTHYFGKSAYSENRSNYEYDEQGRVIKAESYSKWNGSDEIPANKYDYQYNDDGSVVSDLFMDWRNNGHTRRERRCTYIDGSFETERFMLVDGEWIKYEFTAYSSDGKALLSEGYNATTGVLESKREYIYSDEGRTERVNSYGYQDDQVVYGYASETSKDKDGNILYSYYYDWSDGSWGLNENSWKYNYLYDAEGRTKQRVEQRYFDGAWRNEEKIAVARNAKGDVTQRAVYSYDNDAWTQQNKFDYDVFYDGEGKIIEVHIDIDGNWWPKHRELTIEYDTPVKGMITSTTSSEYGLLSKTVYYCDNRNSFFVLEIPFEFSDVTVRSVDGSWVDTYSYNFDSSSQTWVMDEYDSIGTYAPYRPCELDERDNETSGSVYLWAYGGEARWYKSLDWVSEYDANNCRISSKSWAYNLTEELEYYETVTMESDEATPFADVLHSNGFASFDYYISNYVNKPLCQTTERDGATKSRTVWYYSEFDPAGITAPVVVTPGQGYYGLDGRSANAANAGIMIHNGKKMLVK